MSDDMKRLSDDELTAMVNDFIDGGGEVTRLRYATQKDIGKSRRTMYHKDKASEAVYTELDLEDEETVDTIVKVLQKVGEDLILWGCSEEERGE